MQGYPTVLIVEDNEDDAFLIRRAFERANIVNTVQLVKSGEEAIAYLKGEGKYANREEYGLPGLILLDLKMTGIDGFEVLRWVREESGLCSPRVVVLTNSTDVRDVNLAFRLGATSFLIKPADFLRFVEFSQALAGCWVWTSEPGSVEVEHAVVAGREPDFRGNAVATFPG